MLREDPHEYYVIHNCESIKYHNATFVVNLDASEEKALTWKSMIRKGLHNVQGLNSSYNS